MMATALSVPVPTTFSDTNDRFISIVTGAPDFEKLNKIVSYDITLDMMMDSLRSGIDAVAKRTKKEPALVLFQQSLEMVNTCHDLYREGKNKEACILMQHAQQVFRQAGQARSK